MSGLNLRAAREAAHEAIRWTGNRVSMTSDDDESEAMNLIREEEAHRSIDSKFDALAREYVAAPSFPDAWNAAIGRVVEAAREVVQLGNQPGMDDDEWESAMTELEEAVRQTTWGPCEGCGATQAFGPNGHRSDCPIAYPWRARGPEVERILHGWLATKDFLADRLATSGRSDVSISAVLRVMNTAFGDDPRDAPKQPQVSRIDWSNVVVDEGDEAP